MTMNARVKRAMSPGDLAEMMALADVPAATGAIKTYPQADPRDGFVIQCELFHPASVNGRTLLLRLTEQDRDDLLRVLRDESVRARRS